MDKILCFDSCNQTWHGSKQQCKLSQKNWPTVSLFLCDCACVTCMYINQKNLFVLSLLERRLEATNIWLHCKRNSTISIKRLYFLGKFLHKSFFAFYRVIFESTYTQSICSNFELVAMWLINQVIYLKLKRK